MIICGVARKDVSEFLLFHLFILQMLAHELLRCRIFFINSYFKFAVFFVVVEKCLLIICYATGKDGDPRCGAAGAEDTAQRRVSIGKKRSKKITITIGEKEGFFFGKQQDTEDSAPCRVRIGKKGCRNKYKILGKRREKL